MLNGLRIGDELRVKVPALGDTVYTTVVSYMSVLESYATYDAKTFEVRTVPLRHIEGLLPGMTAIVVE